MRPRRRDYFADSVSFLLLLLLFHDSLAYSHRDSGGGCDGGGGGGEGIIKCKLRLYEYAKRRGRRGREGGRERALEETIEERGAKREGVLRRPECLTERERERERGRSKKPAMAILPLLPPSFL